MSMSIWTIRTVFLSFLTLLKEDILQKNPLLNVSKVNRLAIEFFIVYHGYFYFILSFAAGVAATGFLLNISYASQLSRGALCLIAAVLMNYFVGLIHFRFCRFIWGLYSFAALLSLFSRLMQSIQVDFMKQNNQPRKDLTLQVFAYEVVRTFLFDVIRKLSPSNIIKFPTIYECLYFIIVSFLLDGSIFLANEWIPVNISSMNRQFFYALIGGIWVMLSIDWNYCMFIAFFNILGLSFPIQLQHKHPLLSISISEFWGDRWNPIVSKLLQDSCYKPIRRLGGSRIMAVLGCFLGSAFLHAIPQYHSTKLLSDATMMFNFFFGQGLCLLLELAWIQMVFHKKQATKSIPRSFLEINSASSQADLNEVSHIEVKKDINKASQNKVIHFKEVPGQWTTEILVTMFIVLLLFNVLELPVSPYYQSYAKTLYLVNAILGILSMIGFVFVRSYDTDHTEQARKPTMVGIIHYLRGPFLFELLGWIWTVAAVIALLPLFSIPALHAFETMFPASMTLGPLVRSMQTVAAGYHNMPKA